MPYCQKCGNAVTQEDSYCRVCGARVSVAGNSKESTPGQTLPHTEVRAQAKASENLIQAVQTAAPKVGGAKSLRKTTLLAVLPAVLANVLGIGHLYCRKIRRGLAIMFGSWALDAGMIASFVAGFKRTPADIVFIIIGGLFVVFGLGLFAWQIVDARSVCREHNQSLPKT